MARDDVPPNEMQWFSSPRDPIDAVLTGDSLDKDLLDVAVLVHDVQAAYLSENPLRRRPELVAYTGPTAATSMHLDASGPPGHAVTSAPPASAACPDGPSSLAEPSRANGAGPRRVAGVFVGLVGTLSGKVILATAATAATVGALHSAHVVDVPILPDSDRPTPQEPSLTEHDQGAAGDPGEGQPPPRSPGDQTSDSVGQGEGQGTANRSASERYLEQVKDWNGCVAAAVAQNDRKPRSTGGFDARVVCGDKPDPADFGLGQAPKPNPTPGSGPRSGADSADDGASGRSAGDDVPGQTPVPDQAPVPEQAPVPDSVPAGSGNPTGQGSPPRRTGAASTDTDSDATDAGGGQSRTRRPLDTPGAAPR